MYTNSLRTIIVPFVGVVFLLSLCDVNAHASRGDSDVLRVLPAPVELKHFSGVEVEQPASEDKQVHTGFLSAVRDDDGLKLHLTVAIAPTEEAAAKVANNGINTPEGYLPPCSHTGRRFGDEVWHSVESDGGPSRGFYRLVTRMNRAVVVIDVMEKLPGGRVSRHDLTLVDEADMRLTEDLTIGCLQRLARMGIGTMAKATPVDGPPVADILREVISPVAQTPGYGDAHFRKGQQGNDEIEITRKRDGLRMTVHLSISPTIMEGVSLAESEASNRKMAKGSLTTYRFGNDVWHKIGDKPGISFELLTRMGSAVIRLQASGAPRTGKGLMPADCQIAEQITVDCLKRLAARGIGKQEWSWSRPPLPKPWPVPAEN
jgi:hypothetical protein